MPNPNDPRVKRTHQMLRDALIQLILAKGYDNISIQDIAEEAGLRRATFYLHYRDKEELLLTTLRETFDEMVSNMETMPYEVLTEEAEIAIHTMTLEHARDNADLYRALLAGQGAGMVLQFIQKYLADGIREKCGTGILESDLPVPIDVLATALASIKLNMALWWLQQGMPYPIEQMAEMMMRVTLYGARGAMAIEGV